MPLPILSRNDIVEGKWNKNKYIILKKLGEGGIGAVYKVADLCDKRKYALKFSQDNISLNREYNILKQLGGTDKIAQVYEIDDVDIRGRVYYFIVMEYINGSTLNVYRRRNKIKLAQALNIVIELLNFMREIHKRGYILGDSKLDNIIINHRNEIKFIDLGGVVRLGGCIKEFTPAYDRASWGCGYRIAEPSYDIFSATMILVQLLLKVHINPRKQTRASIKGLLDKKAIDDILKVKIFAILNGEKKDAKNFANALLTLYNEESVKEKIVNKRNINYKVNLFFLGSLFLFIFTLWLNFIKK